MGIRVLVKTKNALKQRGGEIAFINLRPQIRKVFDILIALPVFKVFAHIQEFDDYLWSELKKWMPKFLINDKRRCLNSSKYITEIPIPFIIEPSIP
jgi:anti-anti-sigma regulatory factor